MSRSVAKRVLRTSSFLLFVIALALLAAVTPWGQAGVLRLIAWQLSDPGSEVRFGGLSGSLLSSGEIGKIELRDAQGVWLGIEGLAFVWRPMALLAGRIEIERLVVKRALVRRRGAVPGGQGRPKGTAPRFMPMVLREGRIDVVQLDQSVLGVEARLKLTGNLAAGASRERLSGALAISHADGRPGRIAASASYRVGEDQLAVDATASEPAGGLIARLLELPGLPAFTLRIRGDGPLDDWRGRLTADGGESIRLAGEAQLRRDGKGRAASGRLTGRLDGFLPTASKALLGGAVEATFVGRWDDSDHLIVREAVMTTRALKATVSGVADLRRRFVHGKAEVRIGAEDGSPMRIELQPGDAAALKSGRIWLELEPSAGDRKVRATGELEDVSWRGIARKSLSLVATARQPKPFDDAWLDLSEIRVEARTERGQATFSGQLIANNLEGRLACTLERLDDLADVLGTRIAGRLDGEATGRLDLAALAGTVQIAGVLTGARLASPAIDRLLGDKTRFKATIVRTADGSTVLENGNADGADFAATFAGRHATEMAAGTFNLKLSRLGHWHNDLAGALTAQGEFNAAKGRLAGGLTIAASPATWRGKPVEALRVVSTLKGSIERPEAEVDVKGRYGGQALGGGFVAALGDAGNASISNLDLRYGGTSLKGAATRTPDGRLAVEVKADAPRLGELSALLGMPLGGRAELRIARLSGSHRSGFQVEGSVRDLRVGDLGMANARIEGAVTGSFDAPSVHLDGEIKALRTGSLVIDATKLALRPRSGATGVTLQAHGPRLNAHADATITVRDQGWQIALSETQMAYQGLSVRLVAPATFEVRNGELSSRGATLAIGQGRIEISGKVGETLQLSARSIDLPVGELGATFVADVAPSGKLAGTMRVEGSRRSPRLVFDARWLDASSRALREASLPPLALAAQGTWQSGQLAFKGGLGGADGLDVRANGTIDTGASRIGSLRVSGSVPLRLALLPLAGRGTSGSGAVRVDIGATGSVTDPQLAGAVTLVGGAIDDPASGLKLSAVAVDGKLVGRRLEIERLAAEAPRGGSLAARGTISLDLRQGFPANIKLSGKDLSYDDRAAVKAVVNGNVVVSGPLASEPRIAGRMALAHVEITIPEQLPRSVADLEIKHVGLAAAERRRLGLKEASETPRPDHGVAIDLRLASDGRIFVRGRGVEAEFGGDLRLHGSSLDVAAEGQFVMRRGSMALLGRRLDLTRGMIAFPGSLEPNLDLEATTDANGTSITVTLAGRASDPRLKFSSSPDLPQDEILALLLFGRSMTKLSPIQLAQLASEIDKIGGVTGGSGMLDQLRRSIGVDRLDVTTDAKGNAAVSAGSSLTNNVYLGVKQNAGTGASSIVIDLDLTKNIKARGETGSDGNSKLGLGFEYRY